MAISYGTSPIAQNVKNSPAMQETHWFPGWDEW